MASLGQLVIELAANTARLQSDMGKAIGIAERGAAQMKKAFSFFGIAGGGSLIGNFLIGAAENAIKFGDDMQKASVKAGIGGKAISELAYAANLADIDLASLSTAIKKMQVSLSEAGQGAKGPTESLAALGLTFEDLAGKAPDAQFELIGDRISRLKDPADRTRAAVELFGKAGADLLVLFEQGAEGIKKAREEAEKLGLAFDDETLKRMSEADDNLKKLSATWKGLWVTVVASAPEVAKGFATAFGFHFVDEVGALNGQISELEDKLNSANQSYAGRGGHGVRNPMSDAESSALAQQIEDLKIRRALLNAPDGIGGRGVHHAPPGFVNEEDAAASEKLLKQFDETRSQMDAQIWQDSNDSWNEEYDRIVKAGAFYDDLAQQRLDDEAKVAAYREEQAQQLSESAQVWKDAFINAFDDMVNTGKFKWDELLKYLVAEFTRRGIAKLFDSVFSGTNAGGGDWLGSLFKGVGSFFKGVFAGPRASGGPVSAGQTYLVGERGRELFRPSSSGSIVPNDQLGAGGRSVVISPTYNIINPKDTDALPGILRENNKMLVDDLERRGLLRSAA